MTQALVQVVLQAVLAPATTDQPIFVVAEDVIVPSVVSVPTLIAKVCEAAVALNVP